MDEEFDISIAVEQLKSAGRDLSKQLPALLKLGDWYLQKAKTTSIGGDFIKGNALYNAALVRSRLVNDDQIFQRIVETYREFLHSFGNGEEISVDEIRNEINSHKEFLVYERQSFKERIEEIDSSFNKNDNTEDQYEIHAEKMYEVFHDIQDMYIRLVSMLANECEGRLGKPPCDYAIIALGSVARMEATPFSDLEFAILYSDPIIGDKINYFRVLAHFLHLKVINLGETILPALGIKQLNDFLSSNPDSNWFYDSETPRGISFDGAMPWASKTALGRMATTDKPALELIRTPEEMAQLQEEEIAVKEGYHLANIMSRAALLYGNQTLLDEYNDRVAEKLNAKSSAMRARVMEVSEQLLLGKLGDERVAESEKESDIKVRPAIFYPNKVWRDEYDMVQDEGKPTKTVGLMRGFHQMMLDVETYSPFYSYLGDYCIEGGLFDAKKQFYRLISLLLSDLGMIFDIKSPSPWHVISALQKRGIIDDLEAANVKVCLSIANEIRLKTYLANSGQKEMFSPIPQLEPTAEEHVDAPIFRDLDEDIVVRLLSTSHVMFKRCREFGIKYIEQGEIAVNIFQNPCVSTVSSSKATLLGYLYFRLQNFAKALEWMKSESEDSPDYVHSLSGQGIIHYQRGDYEKSIHLFEAALELHYKNEDVSNLNVLSCINNIAMILQRVGQHKKAIKKLEEGIDKHQEIYGEDSHTIHLSHLVHSIGVIFSRDGDARSALEAFQIVEQIHSTLTHVPYRDVIFVNMSMATSLSALGQYAQSLEYVKQALQLTNKVFGEHDISSVLATIYMYAGMVYDQCNLHEEALCFFKQSLDLFQLVFGDNPSPGKIDCLIKLGKYFCRRNQMNEAVVTLESALQQARSLFHGKPNLKVALVLVNLAMALKGAEKSGSEKSMCSLREAKEIMDEILGPNHVHPLTASLLDIMGTVYNDLGDLINALQCFQDALNMNSVIFGNNKVNGAIAALCSNIALVSEKMKNSSQAKEYYTKAVEMYRKISVTKTTCPDFVSSLYRLSSICDSLREQDEALKYLEEARQIAKVTGCKNSNIVAVLMKLCQKYKAMGCVAEHEVCSQEVKDMAKSLPDDDSLPLFMKLIINKLKEY